MFFFNFNVFCNVVFEELLINNFFLFVISLILLKVFLLVIVKILFINFFFKNDGYFLELIFLVVWGWLILLFKIEFFGFII